MDTLNSIKRPLPSILGFFTITLVIIACSNHKESLSELSSVEAADHVFINGKVLTVDKNNSIAEAVIVKGGKIVFVGSTEEAQALNLTVEGTKTIDLQGKVLMPGFIDNHFHAGVSVLTEVGLNLVGLETVEEIRQGIEQFIDDNQDEDIVFGFGINEFVFYTQNPDGTFSGGPTKEFLDHINSDKRIFLISQTGHSAVANSAALEFLGINKDTPDPQPGIHFYARDKNGNPTGHLVEGGAFWSHLPALNIGTLEHMRSGLPTLLNRLPAIGITSVFDAGAPAIERNVHQAASELEASGALSARYFGSHYLISRKDAQNAVEGLTRLQQDFNSDMVKTVSVKFSNDGITSKGRFIQFKENEIQQYYAKLIDAGLDAMIHLTNAQSVNQTLNAFETAGGMNSKSRFTIAHVDELLPQDIPRFGKLGILADLQLSGGGGGMSGHIPLAQMLTYNAKVVLSSDYPASGPLSVSTPFHSIAGAMDFNVSVEALIRAHTIESAYHVRMEHKIGSIEVGKQADLIILDQDITQLDALAIPATQVLFTMLDGVEKHNVL